MENVPNDVTKGLTKGEKGVSEFNQEVGGLSYYKFFNFRLVQWDHEFSYITKC